MTHTLRAPRPARRSGAEPPPLNLSFSFTGRNTDAAGWAARRAARLVAEVTAEQQEAIRALVARAIESGVEPYEAARQIRAMVGLTSRDAAAVMAFRVRAVDSGLRVDKVERQVEAYAERLLRRRAENIARTEIQTSLARGVEAGWKQAMAGGLLGKGATKSWMVTDDDRLCPECAPLDGQTVPINEPFNSGGEAVMLPPLHPSCRCAVAANPGD